jgi:hypothetical protein
MISPDLPHMHMQADMQLHLDCSADAVRLTQVDLLLAVAELVNHRSNNTEIPIIISHPPKKKTIDDAALNMPRFSFDWMGKRPPSKGWNQCGFYI